MFKIIFLIFAGLTSVFLLGGCRQEVIEPTPNLGWTPPEISAAMNDYLRKKNPKDFLLGVQTHQYSDHKYLLFAKHYKDPEKAAEAVSLGMQGLYLTETPFVAKKVGGRWEISEATLAVQHKEKIKVHLYDYCQKRTRGDLKFLHCLNSAN